MKEIMIQENTSVLSFWLGKPFAKQNKINEQRKSSNIVSEKDFGNTNLAKEDLDIPKLIDINYEELNKFHCAKKASFVKKYKDGLIAFCNENVKDLQLMSISVYKNNIKNDNPTQHFISINNNTEFFLDTRDIEYYNSIKEDLNLYVAYKKGYKNKLLHFSFKKNKAVITAINRLNDYVNNKEVGGIYHKDFDAFIDEDHVTRFVECLGVSDKFETIKDAVDGNLYDSGNYDYDVKKKVIENLLTELSNKISKKDVLKVSFENFLINKLVGLYGMLQTIIANSTEEELKKLKDVSKIFETLKLNKEMLNDSKKITSCVKQFIKTLPAGANYQDIKNIVKTHQNKNIKDSKRNGSAEVKNFSVNTTDVVIHIFYIFLLLRHTEYGTHLPGIGEIDTENKTYTDCYIFWQKVRLFNITNNYVERSDFPIMLDKGKIMNDEDLYKEIFNIGQGQANIIKNTEYTLENCNIINNDTTLKIKEILKEALNQESGLLIPHNACVEIPDDFIFKYARFVESKDFITIFLHDSKDRYATEMFVKGEDNFRYWLYNEHNLSEYQSNESIGNLYLKLAACIRDWKVLIERDSTMTCRGPRIPKDVDTERKRWFYLPRVRYNKINTEEQSKKEKIFFSENRIFSGERREHKRKLQKGMKPSKAQMVLAESRGVYIPEGYTYVRKSVWGKLKKSPREIKYRSKSMHGLLFTNEEDLNKTTKLVNMSPAGFEEHCEKYVEGLGYQVYKKWNYDGGIDIRGIKDDGSRLFVQCKHYLESGNPIGPDVIRELKGSTDLERKDLEDCDIKMMVLTSTRYTHKAVQAAEALNIELVTTDDIC
mgnify:FL=1